VATDCDESGSGARASPSRFTPRLRAARALFTKPFDGQTVKPRQLLAIALAAAALAPSAAAMPGLLVGVDDDSLKWYGHTGSLLSIYSSLGVGAVRVTLDWTPGESFPSGTERTELQRAANAGQRIRVV